MIVKGKGVDTCGSIILSPIESSDCPFWTPFVAGLDLTRLIIFATLSQLPPGVAIVSCRLGDIDYLIIVYIDTSLRLVGPTLSQYFAILSCHLLATLATLSGIEATI